VRLSRAVDLYIGYLARKGRQPTTLAGYHDGIEHYVTSFEFSGTGESVGSIIPLPAEPIDEPITGAVIEPGFELMSSGQR